MHDFENLCELLGEKESATSSKDFFWLAISIVHVYGVSGSEIVIMVTIVIVVRRALQGLLEVIAWLKDSVLKKRRKQLLITVCNTKALHI